MLKRSLLLAACILATTQVQAQDVRITTFKNAVTFTLNGQTQTITRTQDTSATLPDEFARVARPCPTDCIQPMIAAPGVTTVGELEVLSFLEGDVTDKTGLLLDARAPSEFGALSIPGAVNVPTDTIAPENRFRDDILRALGAVDGADGTLNFANAMSLTLFSGGVWSKDAPTAIEHLLLAGYPADKLFYYRGGLQAWLHVGLTVQ